MFRFVPLQSRPLVTCFLPSLLLVFMALPSASAWAQTAPRSVSSPAATVAQPPPGAERMPADLSKDARLDRRLSLHEVGTPFNALLKKLNAADLTLTVETDSAEQKLHINIKQRSLRELMQSLADLLSGAWYARQDGGGYRFEANYQTVRRRKRWWELFLAEREKAFDTMRAAVLHTMRTPPKPPVRFVRDHAVEDGIDEETWRKIAGEKTFFGKLPAALQEQVANQIDETPWYSMRGLVTGSGMNEGALFVPARFLPDETRLALKPLIPKTQGDASGEPNVCVQFSNFGLSVMASLVTPDSKALPRMVGTMTVPFSADMLPLQLNQANLPEEVKKRGKAAPPAWKELAACQQSRVWSNDLPKQLPQRQRPNRIDAQEWLAATEGIEFVSDYYTAFGGVTNVKPDKLTQPLKAELNWQAMALDISWKQNPGSDLYLFRNNRWYRDDLLEIPAPILKRLLDYKKRQVEQEWKWQKQGAEPAGARLAAFRAELDGIADAVYTLTPWQLFNSFGNVVVPADQIPLAPIEALRAQHDAAKNRNSYPRRAFEQEITGILFQYHTLRFYGSLRQEERAALLAGRLDVNALTAEQQQQARYLLPLLQVISPPQPGQTLWIGMRPGQGGYVGIPFHRLFLPSLSPPSPQ